MGDIIVINVKDAIPKDKVKKGAVLKVVVRTEKKFIEMMGLKFNSIKTLLY